MFTGCGTALVTPFRRDQSLDEPALRRLVRRQIDAGIDQGAVKIEDEQAKLGQGRAAEEADHQVVCNMSQTHICQGEMWGTSDSDLQ